MYHVLTNLHSHPPAPAWRHGYRLLLIALIVLSGCATTPPRNPDNVCKIFEEKRAWHAVAVKAQEKWGTSMHIPMAIMYQESSFKKNARPPRTQLWGFIPWRRLSSAYGYAQVIDGTWEAYVKATGEGWRNRNNFADATDFVHWYMRSAINKNGIKSDDAYRLYLNYHEGLAGYSRNSHQKKPWLINVAKRVDKRATRFRQQYQACADALKPGFWRRLFSW